MIWTFDAPYTFTSYPSPKTHIGFIGISPSYNVYYDIVITVAVVFSSFRFRSRILFPLCFMIT